MALSESRRIIVSVIVTTYNQEAWIGRALEGILAQNALDFDFEVLVGDDASSDSTASVCERYARLYPGRIRFFRRERNLGIQGNYFDLVERAKGQFLADCAGDDEWVDPDKLSRQVAMMRANPDMAMCHTAWVERNISSGQISPSPHSFRGAQIEPAGAMVVPLLQHRTDRFVHLCTAMWRRDLMMEELHARRDLFIDPQWGLEDLQVEVAMASRGSIGYLPTVTMAYSVGGSSISSGEDTAKSFRFLWASVKLTNRLKSAYGVPSKALNQFFTHRLSHLAKLALNLNDPAKMAAVKAFAEEQGVALTMDARMRIALLQSGLHAPLRFLLALRRKLLK